MLALENDGPLVIAVALVASEELGQMIIVLCSVIIFDADICRRSCLLYTSDAADEL